jgi:hypothetical protein
MNIAGPTSVDYKYISNPCDDNTVTADKFILHFEPVFPWTNLWAALGSTADMGAMVQRRWPRRC